MATTDTTDGTAIAVVIPHLDQPEALRRCLSALAWGARPPDEVVVADNGSRRPPPADLWGALPGARLLRVPEPGPGPARNAGVAATRAPILAFVDADCVPAHDWLATVAAAFAEGTDDVLGGDVRIGPGAPAPGDVVAAYESLYAYRMDRYVAREGFCGAGNLAVRRRVWARVGPFAGIGVAEDRDWGRRATAAGVTVRFVPGMRVHHPARASMAELRTKWDRHLAHDFAELRPGLGPRLRWALKAAALPLSPLAELPRLATTDRLRGGAMRRDALRGLVAIRRHRAARMRALMARPADAPALAQAWNRP